MKRGDYSVRRVVTDREAQPVVGISDVHFGHQNHNGKLLAQVIKYIIDNDAIWFANGDLMENGTRYSVGDSVFSQTISPHQQIDAAVEAFLPIANKCLGMTIGNHDERTYKDTGIDPMQIICDQLGVEYFHHELFAIISRRLGSGTRGTAYTMYANHTSITGKNTGTKRNSVERDVMSWAWFDIIATGHSHGIDLGAPDLALTMDMHNVSVSERRQWNWQLGNYTGRPDSYATKRPFRPKPMGTVVAWLDMTGPKKISPEYILG